MDSEQLKTLKVAVLAGGWSDERDISMQSGTQCRQALLDAGFLQVDLYDIAEKDFTQKLVVGQYDVAFPALHGRYGEDGCIQGFLEILHMPYAFSGVLASAVGTEKEFAKAVFRAAGIRAPRGFDMRAGTVLTDEQVDQVIKNLGLPLFVKPCGNGSSYGISRVNSREELAGAIALAGSAGQRVLVEECVEGTEITVPVIGNDEPEALPVVEIAYDAEFYDLKVKYEPSALHHVIPARLDPEVYARAQEMACRAHKALSCRGCSRSDFIVTAAGEPVILETNTIPGMTESSLLPDSARHAGIEFPQLCTRFVELAMEAAENPATARPASEEGLLPEEDNE